MEQDAMLKKSILILVYISAICASAQLVTVTAPNGGEVFHPGDTVHITWTADTRYIFAVDIQISLDDGKTYVPLLNKSVMIDNVSWGNLAWTVPDSISGKSIISAQCRIKIFNYLNGQAADESDQPFSIAQKPVVQPPKEEENGGKCGTGSGLALLAPVVFKIIRKRRIRG